MIDPFSLARMNSALSIYSFWKRDAELRPTSPKMWSLPIIPFAPTGSVHMVHSACDRPRDEKLHLAQKALSQIT